MSTLSIHTLAEEFCAIAGTAAVNVRADENGVLAFSVSMRGVQATITHDAIDHPFDLMVHVIFGQVPPHSELPALRELLQMNLRMQSPGSPAFGFNAQTGDVVLRYPYPLAHASGQHLWTGLQAVTGWALQWRQDPFFEPPQGPPTLPLAFARPGVLP